MVDSFNTSAAWRVPELLEDRSWIFPIGNPARTQLAEIVKHAFDPDRPLFAYSKDDFDLGSGFEIIKAAAQRAYSKCGFTLVKGLPRDLLTKEEFQLLLWAVGLNLGVARPQGKASQYVSEVRAAGMNYRSAVADITQMRIWIFIVTGVISSASLATTLQKAAGKVGFRAARPHGKSFYLNIQTWRRSHAAISSLVAIKKKRRTKRRTIFSPSSTLLTAVSLENGIETGCGRRKILKVSQNLAMSRTSARTSLMKSCAGPR